MKRDFANASHLNDYMSGCVVRTWEGVPIWIYGIGPNVTGTDRSTWELEGLPVESLGTNAKARSYHFEAIDFEPVPLGMMNERLYNGFISAIYLTRIPRRMWKVGLNARNLAVGGVLGNVPIPYAEDVIVNPGLAEVITGRYPSIEEARRLIKDENAACVAISRDWALGAKGGLYYRNLQVQVGSISPSKGRMLLNAYTYLKESLEETLNDQRT